MRDENNFHSRRELTQSLLGCGWGDFGWRGGQTFQKIVFCTGGCFNVLLHRVNFRSHRVKVSVGLFGGTAVSCGGQQWMWLNKSLPGSAVCEIISCPCMKNLKPLSPSNHPPFLLYPDWEIQLWLNWGDYRICIFELKKPPCCIRTDPFAVSALFRILLALLTAVMNANTWPVEDQWRSQRNHGLM